MRVTTDQFKLESSVDPINLLETVASNAAAASRTAIINLDKLYSHVLVEIRTSRNASTAVTVTTKKSTDGGVNYSSVTSRAISGGASTVSEFTETFTTSSDATITLEYDAAGSDNMTVLVGMTGGGASDTISLRAVGTRVG